MDLSPIVVGTMRLGAWGAKFTSTEYLKFIEEAVEHGFTSLDAADIYGHYTTEAEIGQALSSQPGLRSKLQLISKYGIKLVSDRRPSHKVKSYDSSAKHMIASVEQSLKDFQTDRIELLLLHRPDYLLHPEEIAEAVSNLKAAGKILEFGVSNFNKNQLELMQQFMPIYTNQIEASLLHPKPFESGIIEVAYRSNCSIMAWSPLGGDQFFNGKTETIKRIKSAANSLSQNYNCSIDQLLYAWLLKHPIGIIPVVGTTKSSRFKGIRNALSIDLKTEDWYLLLEASKGTEVA